MISQTLEQYETTTLDYPESDLGAGFTLHDLNPVKDRRATVRTILEDLNDQPPTISSMFFYDSVGCQLFDRITELPEYYLTRTETSILQDRATELTRNWKDMDIVEFGGGNGSKIALLFESVPPEHLAGLRYVPVDISRTSIENSARLLIPRFPGLTVQGMVADFTSQLHLIPADRPRLFCFLGSTLGNFNPPEQRQLLLDLANAMNSEDSFLLGLDLVKDMAPLELAYNDPEGVTADFNRNILDHVNHLAGLDFDPGNFEHQAFFNPQFSRIEMHLRSLGDQRITSTEHGFELDLPRGTAIHTENSHKFTLTQAEALTSSAGFHLEETFTDARQWFALLRLRKAEAQEA